MNKNAIYDRYKQYEIKEKKGKKSMNNFLVSFLKKYKSRFSTESGTAIWGPYQKYKIKQQ